MKSLFPIRCRILLASTGLLAGCVAYQPRPLSSSDEANAFASRRLDAPALRHFIAGSAASALAANWPPASWDLDRLTLAAWFNHPEIAVAQANLESAEAGLITAGARPNPTFGIGPTYDANPASGVSPWTLGFTLDWPIETAGKRSYRLAQAQHVANRARLDIAQTAWEVRSRVRRAMVELETAQRRRAILAQQKLAQEQVVALLEARLQAGESSATEVQLVRVAAAQSALDLVEEEKQSHAAAIRLADALGLPANALDRVEFDFTSVDLLPDAGDAAGLRRTALLHRADVLGALADYDASESALQLEVAKQYPNLQLGPGYAWDQGENKFSLGLSLTLPVLDRNRGPIAEAEAHRREAAARFAVVQARALGECELALAAYHDALAKLRTAEALRRGQRERLRSVQQALDAGATDRVALFQSQAELGAGELARAGAFSEAQVALGAVEDAMQRSVISGPDVPVEILKSPGHLARAANSQP